MGDLSNRSVRYRHDRLSGDPVGWVTPVLEEGEADLGPGKFVDDRGVMHG
jgi:hypothetical protein